MIVVDTNVIAYLMIEGEKTEQAQRTFSRDSNWVLPRLWRHEFLNVLATFVRHGGTEVDEAVTIWQRSLGLFASGERGVDMVSTLRLAAQHNISAYDAQYAVLAMELGLAYVTEDKQLLKTFPELALSMQSFCE
ncbi:MAG: type II toxin-antitoxin system VapC family toxin [Anaerolineae bacterium]